MNHLELKSNQPHGALGEPLGAQSKPQKNKKFLKIFSIFFYKMVADIVKFSFRFFSFHFQG